MAFLESVVDLCLIKLAGKDILESRSLVIFNHMAFPMKLDVMGALVSELLPNYPRLSGFQSVHQSLKRAQELRNSIIHAKWGINQETGKVETSRLTACGKLKLSITPVSVAEIRAVADSIVNAAQDLHVLIIATAAAGTTKTPPAGGPGF